MKRIILILSLVFLLTACKNDLTVEQAKLKVEFENNVSILNENYRPQLHSLFGGLKHYLRTALKPIGNNRRDIENYLRTHNYRYIQKTIKGYDEFVKKYNNAYKIANHNKRVLELTGVKLSFENYKCQILNFPIVVDDSWGLYQLVKNALEGLYDYKSGDGVIRSIFNYNDVYANDDKKIFNEFVNKYTDFTNENDYFGLRLDAEIISTDNIRETYYFQNLLEKLNK